MNYVYIYIYTYMCTYIYIYIYKTLGCNMDFKSSRHLKSTMESKEYPMFSQANLGKQSTSSSYR